MTNAQIEAFDQLINVFDEEGLLPHIEFIGSWTMYLYQFYFGDNDYIPDIRTRDIDILYPNIRKPKHRVDLSSALSKIGFEPVTDRNGPTRFFKDGDFELEFLVQEKGAGSIEPYLITPLSIKAEGLRFMDILIDNAIYIQLPSAKQVMVPHPVALILHKMIINHNRKPEAKKEKDIRSAELLFPYI